MTKNHLALTRQFLYELVWSTPMATLAKEFGITDVGLAKRCRTVDVPIPYRGLLGPSWRRAKAGANSAAQVPHENAFCDGTDPSVRFGLPNEPQTPESPPDPSTLTLLQRLEALQLMQSPCREKKIDDTSRALERSTLGIPAELAWVANRVFL